MAKNNSNFPYQKPWLRPLEALCGICVVLGIILGFFYVYIGGALVGLAAGLCFFKEIHTYIITLREYLTEEGIFKTLMFIGVALYLLLAIPSFIVAFAIGFGAITLLRWLAKKR